jgi:hypothetical protein
MALALAQPVVAGRRAEPVNSCPHYGCRIGERQPSRLTSSNNAVQVKIKGFGHGAQNYYLLKENV